MNKNRGRIGARRTLLACAAALALTAPVHAGTVLAVTGDISPLYGKINPFYGSVSASYGKINPFYGKINPFYGKINPFFGDVTAFWGKINPFTQPTDAATLAFFGTSYDPFWGTDTPYGKPGSSGLNYSALNGFWTSEFNAWTPILANWNAATTVAQATTVAAQIQNGLLAPASTFWGPVIAKSGSAGAAQALLNKQFANAGVSFNSDGSINASSLLNSDPSARAMLFLNLYDSLMDYAGTGHIDWWMGQVGWSPALAQTQGKVPNGGSPPTIGMIDMAVTVTAGADGKPVKGSPLTKQIVQYGSTVFDDGHGAAVGSLIMGAVDGSGVLGVMPTGSVNVIAYNPYDSTGTTNWTDVGTGVATLTSAIFKGKSTPLGVLNASLGEPGYTLSPGWNGALADAGAHGHDLVIAAGNDGVTQTTDVPWNFAANPTLLVVGSVGADGTISNFSNKPGEACLMPTNSSSTVCTESNKLKYRFIVAPGELILVSDGVGGHMRQTGTSLAAPLVSGAIAMLQNRWPWLSVYPDETASIILRSATPKGDNPGADPVYGVGELNIAASQAPLNWAQLVYFPKATKTPPVPSPTPAGYVMASWASVAAGGVPLSAVISQTAGGTQSSWDAGGVSYTAFEQVGNTYRDFQIPLSSKLVGQNVTTLAGGQAYQSYLTAAFRAQTGHFATLDVGGDTAGIFANGFERSTAPVGMVGDMQLRMSLSQNVPAAGFRMTSNGMYQTGASLIGERSAFQFGFGAGAAALDTGDGFTFASDHDLGTGGANPVLGLASGGAYVGGRTALTSRLSVGFGTTQRNAWRNPVSFGLGAQITGSWVNQYAADAQTVNVSYALTPRLITHVGFTHLREQSALLGIQSLSQEDLRGGSGTNAANLGFDLRMKHGLTLSGSGTLARTQASGGALTTSNLTATAAALALTKSGLLGHHDQLRLMAATPLHTVGGQLGYSSVGIVDRQTGEIGMVKQAFAPGTSRMPLIGEVMYGRRLTGVAGEFSLFGRVERANQLTAASAGTDPLGTLGGVQFQLAF